MNKGKVMASHQGSIIKLPCNVGDTVWKNDCGSLCAYTITAFSLGECNGFIEEPVSKKEIILYISNLNGSFTESFPESEIGKTVFLTKQEAEAKILINRQPTAYDVDKVVEQLEELRKECEDPLQDYDPNYFIDKAIEITKGGGVDGN